MTPAGSRPPSCAPVTRKLAINRLRDRRPLDAAAVDRFLARFQVPIIEGPRCTFLYRGEADEVFLVHRVFGLPDRLPLRRLRGTDLWHLVLELPEGSRVEYQLEVVRGGQRERINDPLNPHLARSPMGSSSVCYAAGHQIPDWTVPDPEARPGSLVDMLVPSRALRRDAQVTLYLPARFRRTARYPLLIVHDGGDYLKYAAAKTVLDNLIHRLDVAGIVAAFMYPGDRLAEYANSAAHARFLTAELLPRLEAELPLVAAPSGRCLLGASFGAVASLTTAYRYPEVYGSLVLQSGSFVFTDIGARPRRRATVRAGGPVHEPVPGQAAAGGRPDVPQLRPVRAADHAEPVHGAGVRERGHGRPLRRDARRAQLGELARPAAGRTVVDLPRAAEVLLRVSGPQAWRLGQDFPGTGPGIRRHTAAGASVRLTVTAGSTARPGSLIPVLAAEAARRPGGGGPHRGHDPEAGSGLLTGGDDRLGQGDAGVADADVRAGDQLAGRAPGLAAERAGHQGRICGPAGFADPDPAT